MLVAFTFIVVEHKIKQFLGGTIIVVEYKIVIIII